MLRRLPRRQMAGMGLLVLLVAVTFSSAPEPTLGLVERTVSDPAAFALALVGLYLIRPVLAIPTMAAAAVVGYGYGVAVGVPVALLGTTLSSIPPYLAGRYLRCTDGLLGRLCASGEAYFEVTGDVRGVLAARLAPTPSDPISYAAGLSRVRPQPFLVGTVLGELHWTVLAVVAGASVRDLSAGALPSVPMTVIVLTAVAALAVLAGPAYRSALDRRTDGVES